MFFSYYHTLYSLSFRYCFHWLKRRSYVLLYLVAFICIAFILLRLCRFFRSLK
ncbi:hypothetical protein BC629DRAFT_1554079 [Irpex lacteus]|nr:hypothetical protein BC629DRAFT_1554079 [Irpex lacteus]